MTIIRLYCARQLGGARMRDRTPSARAAVSFMDQSEFAVR
jgi:hypothetical protein